MKKLQIGVMGSVADLNYSKNTESIAARLGARIAETSNILIFGAEKDYDSLSTIANRSAKQAGGITIGITYGKKHPSGIHRPY
jgi:predicted Rossmann-fold nucleotide-binding protein